MELKLADSQVYSLEELQLVADLAKEHNVAVISDEVYEYLVYPPNKHFRIGVSCVLFAWIYHNMNLPQMLFDLDQRLLTFQDQGTLDQDKSWKPWNFLRLQIAIKILLLVKSANGT